MRFTNTKAQEHTIAKLKEHKVHLNNKGIVTISIGELDNRVVIEIDSKGKILNTYLL